MSVHRWREHTILKIFKIENTKIITKNQQRRNIVQSSYFSKAKLLRSIRVVRITTTKTTNQNRNKCKYSMLDAIVPVKLIRNYSKLFGNEQKRYGKSEQNLKDFTPLVDIPVDSNTFTLKCCFLKVGNLS